MPELPDVTVYVEALERHCIGHELDGLRLQSPFLVRSVTPSVRALQGRTLRGVSRMAKQLVFDWGDELYMVLHLMVAGRLYWRERGAGLPGKRGLMALDWDHGTLLLTEASSKKRASLHLVQGRDGLAGFDPGGIDPLTAEPATFSEALTRENRTLKRALTDQRLVQGIGNAYSDEVLHAAQLSPVKLTSRLTEDELVRLHEATRETLTAWTRRLRDDVGDGFPERVTAFRDGFAAHGRYGEPCPACGTAIQRILRKENEVNYCPTCQTGGKLLADRALSTLMRGDWPDSLDELEARKTPG